MEMFHCQNDCLRGCRCMLRFSGFGSKRQRRDTTAGSGGSQLHTQVGIRLEWPTTIAEAAEAVSEEGTKFQLQLALTGKFISATHDNNYKA